MRQPTAPQLLAGQRDVELFTIQCTTCRARLKVKDESAVGSILNCPRCGSMVQVVPPVGWKLGAATGESPALSESGVSNSTAPLPAAAAAPVIAAAQSSPGPIPPSLPATVRKPPAAVAVGVSEAALPSAEPAMPSPAWIPPVETQSSALAARLRADAPLWAGGLSAGAVAGAMIWFVAVRGSDVPPTITAPVTSGDVASAAPASTTATEPQAATPATQPAAALNDAVAEVPPATSGPAVTDEPLPETSTTQPTQAIAPLGAPTPASTPAASTPEAAPAEVAVPQPTPPSTAEAEPKSSLKLDPATPAAAGEPLDPLVESILGPASAGDADGAIDDADTPVDNVLDESSDDTNVRLLTQEDVDAAMAVRVSEVRFVGVPLAQFVEFIADMTALKFTVDDAALAKTGKKRSMPLSVHLNDTTAQDALRAALTPLGLTYELRDQRVFVTVANDSVAK